MANTCLISAYIINGDKAANAKIHETLTNLAAEANGKLEGFRAGSDRYIFDARVTNEKDEATVLDGWVKWGYEDDEVKALVKFLEAIAPYESLVLECTTPDSEAHAKYIYNARTRQLVCVELPGDRWPGDDYVKLCEALNAHGVKHEIPMD